MDKTTLWLVKKEWSNDGDYDFYDGGTDVIGVFDSLDLAVAAIRDIYAKEVDRSVLENAINYCSEYWSTKSEYIFDYCEHLENGGFSPYIHWTKARDDNGYDIYEFEFAITPITLNEPIDYDEEAMAENNSPYLGDYIE